MPYFTEDTAPRSQLSLSEIPTSFSEVMEAQFASTVTELPLVAGKRAAELFAAERRGLRIDQAAALARIKDAGLEGALAIDPNGTTQAALDILIERKRDELSRANTLARAQGGFLENAARFGVALGTSLADPLNVGLSFVPIVGQARYARMLELAGGAFGRAGVRAGVGAIEGAAGAAVIEPIIYSAKQYEQADYDMTDSLLNVAFGTVLGGGLHVVGGASLDAWRAARGDYATPSTTLRNALDAAERDRAARAITGETIEAGGERLSQQLDASLESGAARIDGEAARVSSAAAPETREAALRIAEGQVMSGQSVNVEPLFAGERGRLPDGTDTADLVADRFRLEAQRARTTQLAEVLDRRIARIEEQARAAGGEGNPRYTPRLLRELDAARASREAVQALSEGKALTAGESERVRQAAVTEAVERGVPVPDAALERLPDSVIARAGEIRQSAAADATRTQTSAPDPEVAAQIERSTAIDEELAKADDTLEAAEEEAKLAEQLLAEQAARFGDEAGDGSTVAANELADRLTTWARVAELAQVCVLRGG